MLIREAPDALKVYVNGGAFTDKDWDSTEGATDAHAFRISNIGASTDDVSELGGYVKDVLIYNGTALNGPQRLLMYDYLDGQLGTS